ncbi:MAG: methylenetetrahydrofolate--tRNA-(uracil(54)-C(5))-methyltransferase (FADH(2)-oxidizing) TrmFO [Chloroflexi bacterium]|nr:methylenetetrahydrofolate--tRNA-(uracil(54)-C(5))-methyltransferase (FADH(2)-oxidizing) TrmFO [Chloroflexota bacterium]
MQPTDDITIIGAGLAGSEAAWQAASRGARVALYEMRPQIPTPAHRSADLAELVCSNSFGSSQPERAPGMLKCELRMLHSLILHCAEETAVPAGSALAVDRERFAKAVTEAVSAHPNIRIIREEIRELPREGIVICASGPLTSDALAEDIRRLVGQEALAFYDAMAPIAAYDSIDRSKTYRATRYGRGDADYICCPLDEDQYAAFVRELVHAERHPLRDFELGDKRFFEACLPVEVLAARGPLALAYGPMRPRGLRDPHTGHNPFAVAQLRQDNLAGTLFNLVGFQTNLLWGEQKRVLSLIPGLEHAEWVRYGQMHRNTFINSPELLAPTLQWRNREALFFAGQITGTEGYMGSTASGLMAGINAARLWQGLSPTAPPATTMLGALLTYISASPERPFQPMKANLGLLPLPEGGQGDHHQQQRALAARAEADLRVWLGRYQVLG